ncbi:MAG TPA: hypothetical protein VN578_21105 [Candidatus Binatia bacterium]|nr:hypothetical protein [Candidatus Binatia bacterium]
MKHRHIIFNVVGIVIAGIVSVSLLGALTGTAARDPIHRGQNFWVVLMLLEVLIILLVGVGSLANLSRRGLAFWPTISMIVGYFISVLFLPFGIWGIVALYLERKRRGKGHRWA